MSKKIFVCRVAIAKGLRVYFDPIGPIAFDICDLDVAVLCENALNHFYVVSFEAEFLSVLIESGYPSLTSVIGSRT
jgi:hypothetical protein